MCTVTTSRRINWENKIHITDSEHTFSMRTSLVEMPPWNLVTWPWLTTALIPAMWEQHNIKQNWKCNYELKVSKASKTLGSHHCKWNGTNRFPCVSPMESKSSNTAEHLLGLMVLCSSFFSSGEILQHGLEIFSAALVFITYSTLISKG